MNADMFNRGTEDPHHHPLSHSLSLSFFFRGDERPLRPSLDPPLPSELLTAISAIKLSVIKKKTKLLGQKFILNNYQKFNVFKLLCL